MKENKGITIGTSFSPEELEHKGLSYFQAVEALEIVHKEFGIKDIRLGIRWNKAVEEDGDVDLEYYKPFLDYCLTHDVRLTLNVGPIKTFRWPEDHVPKFILNKLKQVPRKGSSVDLNDELAEPALHYLEELLNELKATYSEKELENIVMIQPENEAFNSFGVHKWTMSNEYMKQLVHVIWEFFLGIRILLSSSGCLDIPQCLSVASGKYEEHFGLFAFGVNYYYKTPFNQSLPFLNWYDDIWRSRLNGFSCKKNKQLAEAYGYKIEVTEAQLEGWGPKIKGPGRSVKEFKKMMRRIEKHILPKEGGLVRVWGIENFARDLINKNITPEQISLIKEMRDCNYD
ncbi:hypothetical protein GF389_01445 [Candidatus Dojkabacteria bacterium]|nr:hypothetical protein [Candidatus Dojkabacteria bacterium]